MSRTSIFAVAVFVLIASALPFRAAAAQGVDCDAIAGYIETVEILMIEEMLALVTGPEWGSDAKAALDDIETRGMESMTSETLAPLLAYIGIPGEVLTGMDIDDVPEAALPLHESATQFWLSISVSRAAAFDGDDAAMMEEFAAMEEAFEAGIAAQVAIFDSCPDILASFEDARASLDPFFNALYSSDDIVVLQEATADDLDGLGSYYLFFAAEDAQPVDATPAA